MIKLVISRLLTNQSRVTEDNSKVNSDCESGWVKRAGSNSCYKFEVSSKVNWQTADKLCISLNGTLAILETEEEIVWMYGYRSFHEHLRSNTWIGGFKSEGDWYWKTTTGNYSIAFLDWAARQPDNLGGSQNCLALFGEFTINNIPVAKTWFRFDDDTCPVKNSYVCERN